MAQSGDTAALYDTLLDVNEQAHDAGHYEIVYHALAGALHAAEVLKDAQRLKTVEHLAEA